MNIHVIPRLWSNAELRRFAPLFSGAAVNVSAWKDEDKEGRHYRDYFTACASYALTNYKAEMRGAQGADDEVFLDLEADLDPSLAGRFDVVFNHTSLEHVYDCHKAFANICAMSRDAVVIVLPFLQQQHADYGDYWRFSPMAVERMFADQGFTTAYLSFNTDPRASVYIFAIGVRDAARWRDKLPFTIMRHDPTAKGAEPFAGCRAFQMPPLGQTIKAAVKRLLGKQ